MEMNPIGTEHYELATGDSGVSLTSTFGFVDRGRPDTTRLTLNAAPDLVVRRFNLTRHAPPSADTPITSERTGDSLVTSDGPRLTRRPAPERYFTIAGYAPFVVQQELVRYWTRHGRPDTLPLFPEGPAGHDRDGARPPGSDRLRGGRGRDGPDQPRVLDPADDGAGGHHPTVQRADLIVLDRDPLADIGNTRSVHLVIAAGRPYDPVVLWRSAGFRPARGRVLCVLCVFCVHERGSRHSGDALRTTG